MTLGTDGPSDCLRERRAGRSGFGYQKDLYSNPDSATN